MWVGIHLFKSMKHEHTKPQKLPTYMVNRNKESFMPSMVSFGPYNQNEPHLKGMEKHKQRAFSQFLRRSLKPVDSYVNVLAEIVPELMASYDQPDIGWKEDKKRFLMLMTVDGCFLIEVLRVVAGVGDYPVDDPLFSYHGKLNAIPSFKRDILLLENQVPLLVLDRLLSVESGDSVQQNGATELIKLMEAFCRPYPIMPEKIGQCQHILDVYRKSLIGFPDGGAKLVVNQEKNSPPHLATEMTEGGIKLGTSPSRILTDISFSDRTLRLPRVNFWMTCLNQHT